ncbi:MAG: SGNH/GDSL hydrolase family protein, partial [Ruthenibacterium sp.]
GACASRPGMAYTNLLSRQLGIEWINFGFSGNGNGETAVIQLAASIPNVRLFVVDYEANAGLNGVLEKTFDGVIDVFRAAHPHTPILVLSLIKVASLMHSASQQAGLLRRRTFMQKNIADRVQNGDENLFFLDGGRLLGEDWQECTVDGLHPNDLGFYRMAEHLREPIQACLDKITE